MGREPPTLLTPQCKRSFTAALMPVNGLVPGLPLMRPTFLIRLARVEEAAALSDLGFRSKAVWGYDPEFMALVPATLGSPERIPLPAMCGSRAEPTGVVCGKFCKSR